MFVYIAVVLYFYLILFLTDAKYSLLPDKVVFTAIAFVIISLVAITTYDLAVYYNQLAGDAFGKYLLQAGSNRIVVKDPGDFQVGHGVLVSGNDSYTERLIWRAATQVAWQTDMLIRPQLDDWWLWVPTGERIIYGYLPANPDCGGELRLVT